ncbi:hypothetical protein, partial [Methylacidiphilum caldifontis]|uniref:hypothetical protein n=1 Tax=Methylacidiphilum caldifontis TaxID=2795386 RepID=UPI001ABCF53A
NHKEDRLKLLLSDANISVCSNSIPIFVIFSHLFLNTIPSKFLKMCIIRAKKGLEYPIVKVLHEVLTTVLAKRAIVSDGNTMIRQNAVLVPCFQLNSDLPWAIEKKDWGQIISHVLG